MSRDKPRQDKTRQQAERTKVTITVAVRELRKLTFDLPRYGAAKQPHKINTFLPPLLCSKQTDSFIPSGCVRVCVRAQLGKTNGAATMETSSCNKLCGSYFACHH